jgi:hypothetical protein
MEAWLPRGAPLPIGKARSRKEREMKAARAATAAVAAGSVAAYARVVRPWHQRWGATDEELDVALPGDDMVAEPASQTTRAVTIDASPHDVWPWIVQLGADRGGFYSYDWLENLFGLRIHSAGEIVDAWQDLRVGDVVYANRARTGGWYVVDLRPYKAMVLKVAKLAAGRPLQRDEQLRWEFLWTFAVRSSTPGSTRLIVRERVAFDSALTRALMAPVGLVSFLMTRRMLLGVKARAEGRGADAGRAEQR